MPAEPIAIHTDRLLLRDFTPTDLDGVAALVGDDEVTQWLSFDSRTRDEAADMLAGILARQQAKPRTEYYLAITTTEDTATLTGFVRLGLGGGHHAADLGYALRPAWQGHGYAREAATAMIEFGFTKLGLHRIVANIGPANQASMNLVEQLGFTYEGTIRDHVHTNGAWRDSRSYSLLAHESERVVVRGKFRQLPNLTPEQVVELQDALLANADTLLTSALRLLESGSVALARSLAILGMEESGKAIAIHDRRVQMAYAPEGTPFVTPRLSETWASHQRKLELVYEFLVEERYFFASGWPDPAEKRAEIGTIKRWTTRHDNLKKRGFYVELGRTGQALTPAQVVDTESLAAVIGHVHQIGWQIRLGEYIEAKGQAAAAADQPPMTEADVAEISELFDSVDPDLAEQIIEASREGSPGKTLANEAYRLKLPVPGSNPFANLGKPGYEAETREILALIDGVGSGRDDAADNDSDG